MTAPSAKILVSVNEKFSCIRISGRANIAASVDFKALLDQLLQRGCNLFVLDLTDCAWMDSTFLGVLAGFALKLQPPQPGNVERRVELFNLSGRLFKQLEEIGVLHLFKVTDGAPQPEKCGAQDISSANASREDVTRTCLEAHQTLMNINPENIARFKDVAAFLAEDLKKVKPQP